MLAVLYHHQGRCFVPRIYLAVGIAIFFDPCFYLICVVVVCFKEGILILVKALWVIFIGHINVHPEIVGPEVKILMVVHGCRYRR